MANVFVSVEREFEFKIPDEEAKKLKTVGSLIRYVKNYSKKGEETVTNLERKAIKRGLDLQGGVHLVMEPNLPSLVEQLATNKDSRFYDLFDNIKNKPIGSGEDFITFFLTEAESRNFPLDLYFNRDKRIDENNNVREVSKYLRDEADDAVERALEILRNRVDEFGVAEPNILKQGAHRIIVELAGVDDIGRAKELIGKTAKLEFKLLKSIEAGEEVFDAFDRILRQQIEGKPISTDTTKVDSLKAPKAPSTMTEKSLAELLGQSDTTLTEADKESTVLVDEKTFGEGPFRSLLANFTPYGGWNGVHEQNVPAVKRLLEREDFQKVIPTDAAFYWDAKPTAHLGENYYELFLLEKDVALGGEVVTDARPTTGTGYDPTTAGKPLVSMTMDRGGSKDWSRITGANIEKRIAIVLDDKVYSAPVVRTQIRDGRSSIEGIPTMNEAKDLSIILRTGSFSVDMDIIAEQSVGASLGADSIRKGSTAAAIGFLLVVIFMIIYYKMSGSLADIALLLNLIFIMAVLAGFHATLTMPGIAGLILTIGMAVDANVLIFERIREELQTGKTIRAAIDSGYSRAFITILDANITTLIAAVVLYQYGTGPIKGFALVLMIGVSSSMFTAIVVTRCIFDFITGRYALQELSI
ncbi:hypothetical protein AMJ80_01405 [bacterium SM23_31]|nr:MAG: hypothetical protein AMJ80_01405 [bacterium SM23_31]